MKYERELIVEYGKKMSTSGLCPGTSGNLSIFDPALGYAAISPSGMDYFETTPEDVVLIDLNGNTVDGKRKPSSEIYLHTEFYKAKPGLNAVVHTHSEYCTALSVLGMPLRAVHFIVGSAGAAEVKCAPYVLFGSKELAETAVKYCRDARAVLLGNHGIVCCDKDIKSAFELAMNMEYAAKLQYLAMSVGEPRLLSDDEMKEALKKFGTYGQPKTRD